MKILIVDIETTNFLQRRGKIVEVGIVRLDLETGEKRLILDEVCWEEGITKEECDKSWIIKNSDLTTEIIQNSMPFETLKGGIQAIFNTNKEGVTAFNNVFDFAFLEDRGIVIPNKLPCPMKVLTPIMKLKKKNGHSGYKWPNVEEAFKFYFPKSRYVERHRGADDALHEADIVYAAYKKGHYKLI